MKIRDIEWIPVDSGPLYESSGLAVIIVLVHTDEGITGIGEASLAGRGRAVMGVLDHYRDLLVGQDSRRIEHIWSELVRGTFWSNGQIVMSAAAGVDMALWDIKGKALGVPVYELLGGPTRDHVRVYRHVRGLTIDDVLEDSRRWYDKGYQVLRYAPASFIRANLKGWDPPRAISECVALIDAVRSEFGDAVDLIMDVHTTFSPIEAVTLGRALEPYRLLFLEDPIRPMSPTQLRLVRQKTNVPIGTGEMLGSKWEFQPLIEEELVDYLRIDPAHAGGITEPKKILAAAEIHGQRAALHHCSSPVNAAACLHINAAIPNFGIQEWVESEPLYEIFPDGPRSHNGIVELPTGPGLGLTFDEKEARKRHSRDRELPHRYWADGSVADY